MSSAPSYLVQILLPKETGSGQPIAESWFEGLLQELTDKFGGATSFVRAPGQGLWRKGGEVERDNIAVIEIMTTEIDRSVCQSLRERIERELSQEEVIIRAQEIALL
jgi:hypothetical protein